MDWHNNFLQELTTDITIDSHLDRRLELLLIDYLVSLKAGKSLGGINHLGASLAMSSSATDSDDFDWTFMTHPGSVIWSAIFHQLFMNPESIHDIKLAAYYGYRVNASTSGAFGVLHRQNWHATAISGAFAAAAASNVMIKAAPDQFFSSLLHVAANMGGIALADRRTGAAIFNRGAATTLGILASEAALANIPCATSIWEGKQGLIELFSLEKTPSSQRIFDGISTTGIRLHPCNGFMQSAYQLIQDARSTLNGELISIHVGLAANLIPFLDGTVGGSYWDAQYVAAQAWDADRIAENLGVTKIIPIDLKIGASTVEIKTTGGEYKRSLENPPGIELFTDYEMQLQNQKFDNLVGKKLHEQARSLAHKILNSSADLPEIKSFIL